MLLEKFLEESLRLQEIKPVSPKGYQPWIFIGRTDDEAPILWPSDVKSWLTEKDPDDGKDWREKKKGVAEVEVVGWHHWLNGHEFEPALGDGEGQESLACCNPWGCKESDMTEWLKNNKKEIYRYRKITKIMASDPITLWEIDGETVETVSDYFFGLQNHCRWWLQSWN